MRLMLVLVQIDQGEPAVVDGVKTKIGCQIQYLESTALLRDLTQVGLTRCQFLPL